MNGSGQLNLMLVTKGILQSTRTPLVLVCKPCFSVQTCRALVAQIMQTPPTIVNFSLRPITLPVTLTLMLTLTLTLLTPLTLILTLTLTLTLVVQQQTNLVWPYIKNS